MRNQYKVLAEKYELILEANTEQPAQQGREIKGVFVPAEIENWINNVLQIPIIGRKKQAPKKRIRKIINGKWQDFTNSYTDVQNKYSGWTIVGVKKANDYTVKELSFIVNKIYKTYGHIKEAENLNEIRKSIINELNKIRTKEYQDDYSKKYYATEREEIVIAAKQGNWRPWIESRVANKNSSARQENSWKWMATVDYILKIWPKDNKCPILGTPFTLLEHEEHNPNNPSIDRINASLDYIPGNVRVISHRANTIKNKGTAEEINTVAEWMKLNGATPDFFQMQSEFNTLHEAIVNDVNLPDEVVNWITNTLLLYTDRARKYQKLPQDYNKLELEYIKNEIYPRYGHLVVLDKNTLVYIRNKIRLVGSREVYIKKRMLSNAKKRAKNPKSPKQFNITAEDVLRVWPQDNRCPVLGYVLNQGNTKFSFDTSPALDRIDSNKGYTPDNIIVMSNKANTLKSNATWQELKRIVDYINGKI